MTTLPIFFSRLLLCSLPLLLLASCEEKLVCEPDTTTIPDEWAGWWDAEVYISTIRNNVLIYEQNSAESFFFGEDDAGEMILPNGPRGQTFYRYFPQQQLLMIALSSPLSGDPLNAMSYTVVSQSASEMMWEEKQLSMSVSSGDTISTIYTKELFLQKR